MLEQIKKERKALGITKNITNHTFRHYVVTKIFNKTANIEAVKAITGHKDTRTIQDHYIYANPEMVEPGSPIVVIEAINEALKRIANRYLIVKLYFFEGDKKRFESLKDEIDKIKEIDKRIQIVAEQGEFEEKVWPVVKSLREDKRFTNKVVPSFYFIDPFGVKGFSLELIGDIFKLGASEIFLLFDVDGFERNLMAKNYDLLDKVYGVPVDKLKSIAQLTPQRKRFQELHKLFIRVLRAKGVSGVMPFSMFDKTNRVLYDLFFLTGNKLGYVRMKEAMWKVDESGDFRFSDADHGDQLKLEFPTNHEDNLWKVLYHQFRGQSPTGHQVKEFVELNTAYLNKHKTATLRKYESQIVPENHRIMVTSRQRKSTYPNDCLIMFPGG